MNRGLFITFEGPDGSGKSTQIKNLKIRLEKKGLQTVLTREPGGTAISENIRKMILDVKNSEMDSLTEALLYAAARAQHVTEIILPALKSNKTVICDRFMDSSIAYQGYGRKLGDQVRIINEYAVRGLLPDITFLLLLDPSIGKERIKREYDRLELEQIEFHQDVYQGYLEVAKNNPKRVIMIDATKSIMEIENEIELHLDGLMKKIEEKL
jgi:dTMP kinase